MRLVGCFFIRVRFFICKVYKVSVVVRLFYRVVVIVRDVCEVNFGEFFIIFLYFEGEIIYNGFLRK